MAQTTQQPILKMEIIDNYICTQHLVGGGEVEVCLVELGPSRCLMEINNVIGDSCFILDVEVELLQVCGPPLMVLIL